MVHAYSAAIESPRGAIHARPDDPSNFSILPIGVSGSLDKYSFLHRVIEERRFGMALADAIIAADPDVVILGRRPTMSSTFCAAACRPRCASSGGCRIFTAWASAVC